MEKNGEKTGKTESGKGRRGFPDLARRSMNRAPIESHAASKRITNRFRMGEAAHRDRLWFDAAAEGREAFKEFMYDRWLHARKHMDGLTDGGEDHAAAAAWFVLTAMHVEEAYGWKLSELLSEAEAEAAAAEGRRRAGH